MTASTIIYRTTLVALLLFGAVMANCTPADKPEAVSQKSNINIIPGADQTQLYVSYLKGKNIGMVINQTSVIGPGQVVSVDSLLSLGIAVKKVYGPEHGVRGNASNGARVADSVDPKTGIPLISLYGQHYKPTADDLKGIDLMVFDIQDVGARFYTYISTLHYVMEACAENNIELLILDRPNPNGFSVDGPILDTAKFRSFVGMHPIPITHGMTIAEYAQMINGEGWLKNKVKCKLKIIKVQNYTHASDYTLPIPPSPNLNTQQSILLYPSTCLFEGTTFSLGRGTMMPFQILGHPALKGKYSYSFTPKSIAGMSENPPQKDKICYGINLSKYNTATFKNGKIDLSWLISFYKQFPDKSSFFNAYFAKLAGTDQLRKQIQAGKTEQEIRKSWEPGLSRYKAIRSKYLIYQ